jgi:hypothetical protein
MMLELLQEYIANKPFLVTLENLKKQLANAKGRIRELEEELDNGKAFERSRGAKCMVSFFKRARESQEGAITDCGNSSLYDL